MPRVLKVGLAHILSVVTGRIVRRDPSAPEDMQFAPMIVEHHAILEPRTAEGQVVSPHLV